MGPPCCLCVCLFPRNVFVFYAVRIYALREVSKESRESVLRRTSCYFFQNKKTKLNKGSKRFLLRRETLQTAACSKRRELAQFL
jgi:hypothetical protein